MLFDFSKLLTRDNPNMIVLLCDSSSSMSPFRNVVSNELKTTKDYFAKLEEDNTILILRADFSGSYKERKVVAPNDLDTSFNTGGKSILYYALCRIRESLLFPEKGDEGYVVKMLNDNYSPNVILFVISDGKDEGSDGSGYDFNEAYEAVEDLNLNNVDTHFLLFGKENEDIPHRLGFKHIHLFDKNKSGIVSMFDTIKECSRSKIIDTDQWFSNV